MIFDKIKSLFNKKNDISQSQNSDDSDILNVQSDNFENVDSDMNSDLDKSSEEEIEEVMDLLDAGFDSNDLINNDESEAETQEETMPSDGNVDLDAAIQDLLNQDAETELVNVDYDFINDVSVYDTLRNDKEAIKEEIKQDIEVEEETDKSDNKIFYYIIGFLMFAVVIASVVFVVGVIKLSSSKPVENTNISLVLPEYKSNNANYTYIGEKAVIDNNEIVLSKMLVDSVATLFYFDGKLDLQKYNIMLIDDKNNMYNMDLSFVQNTTLEEESDDTVIRFEPFTYPVSNIILSIFNPVTGEKTEFPFNIDSALPDSPVKYVSDKKAESNNQLNIKIDNAVFSSAGSQINYVMYSAPNANYSISHGTSTDKSRIILEEGSTSVAKTKKYPSVYSFDSGRFLIGRMDFASIRNLNSKLYITFEDLFKKYVVNKEIRASALSQGGNDEKKVEFIVDNYKIVAEGLGFFNDKLVLVMHAEDTNLKADPSDQYANRVEMQIDAEIVVHTSSGMEIILDGTSRSADFGTDMIFNVPETAKTFTFGAEKENIAVNIKSVLIKTDDVVIPIDLSKEPLQMDSVRKDISEDIVKSFEERLAYKSNLRNIGAIAGFEQKLLENETLMSNYTPETLTEKPLYSAQVVAMYLNGNNCYAVVQEVWKGVNGVKETHFYRTHKVSTHKTDLRWVIDNDLIIK